MIKQRKLNLMRREVHELANALQLLKEGALILDEVDWLLHPLKSELNWPLGKKEPLDFTRGEVAKGLRWQIPFFLLDGIMYAFTNTMTVPFQESRIALGVLSLSLSFFLSFLLSIYVSVVITLIILITLILPR